MAAGSDALANLCDGHLHVHDLPQIWQKPTYTALLQALELLALGPPTFNYGSPAVNDARARQTVDSAGVPRYLTSIVASSLAWIRDDREKEQIWNVASLRLSERSGRSAMPSMTRSFVVNDQLTVKLHEPSLTEDNLGLKTWTSSLLLSRRLACLRSHVPTDSKRVLELGAGTGLVGISAACLWHANVVLTDLPEIVPNLQQNLILNADVIRTHSPAAEVSATALDWSNTSSPTERSAKFQVILAADPIYSAEHPAWLVGTVCRWLRMDDPGSRFIIELPLRDHYEKEREQLRRLLIEASLQLLEEDTETGYDDWHTSDGSSAEVECWWSVWKPASDYMMEGGRISTCDATSS